MSVPSGLGLKNILLIFGTAGKWSSEEFQGQSDTLFCEARDDIGEIRKGTVAADSRGQGGCCPPWKKRRWARPSFRLPIITREGPLAPDTAPNKVFPAGRFQCQRHHRCRGGRLPPLPRTRGGITKCRYIISALARDR